MRIDPLNPSPSSRLARPDRLRGAIAGQRRRAAAPGMAIRHVGFAALGLLMLMAQNPLAHAQNLTQIENQERIKAEMASEAATLGQSATAARRIPDGVQLGVLKLHVFPGAWLDGQAVTLAPGFRLLDGMNRIVVPASVLGRSHSVAYRKGPVGQVLTAWIISTTERDEIRRRQ